MTVIQPTLLLTFLLLDLDYFIHVACYIPISSAIPLYFFMIILLLLVIFRELQTESFIQSIGSGCFYSTVYVSEYLISVNSLS